MTKEKFVVGSDEPLCPIPPSKVPNSLTYKTLIKSRKGEDIFTAASTSQLFKQLGIKCPF
jgi:hypothetical protein